MPRVKEELSVLGFGCMRLPTRGGQIDEAKAQAMMKTALENGVNFIDTARPYHGGTCEPFVGRALKGARDKVQLSTKLPSWDVTKREDLDFHLNEQLEQLQTDHIDFYILHALTESRWENLLRLDAMSFMEKARAAGKIRYICFSFHDGLDTFQKIVDFYPWDMCMIQLNFLDDGYQAGLEGLRYARGKDIGVVVMEPLKGGCLTVPMPKELEVSAKEAGYDKPTLADLGLRWVWNQPEVGLLLSGMTEPEQMEQNIASAANSAPGNITREELELVKAAKEFFSKRMKVNCTSCAYCKPCPRNIDIPQCFNLHNNASISGNLKGPKFLYNYLLMTDARPEKGAGECIDCGVCEPKCPQYIPIREKLKEVAAIFEAE